MHTIPPSEKFKMNEEAESLLSENVIPGKGLPWEAIQAFFWYETDYRIVPAKPSFGMTMTKI